jgi:hypothetical protein
MHLLQKFQKISKNIKNIKNTHPKEKPSVKM